MYKDTDKQREANRERQRRYRALRKGVTEEGVTPEGVTGSMDIETLAMMDEACGDKLSHGLKPKFRMTVMERLFYRPASELKSGELNFVSLPGRACYGVFE